MSESSRRVADEIRRQGQRPDFEKLWRAAMLVPPELSVPPSHFPADGKDDEYGWGIATMRSVVERETPVEPQGTEQCQYESVLVVSDDGVLLLWKHTATRYASGHPGGDGVSHAYSAVDAELTDFEDARVTIAEAFEELAQLVERGGREEGGVHATIGDQSRRATGDARHAKERRQGIDSMFDCQRQQIGAYVDSIIEDVLAAFQRGDRRFFVRSEPEYLEQIHPGITAGELLEDAIVADLSRRLQTKVLRDYNAVHEGGFYISFGTPNTPSQGAGSNGDVRPWAPPMLPSPTRSVGRGGGLLGWLRS